MKARKVGPKPKRTAAQAAEEAANAKMLANDVAKGNAAKVAAAQEATRTAAAIRDKAIKEGTDYEGFDRNGNPMKKAAGYATQANVLGGAGGPKQELIDTGRGVKGGTKAMVKKAKRRASRSGASPQAKMAAKRIY